MIDDNKIEKAATVASITDTEKGRVREGYVIKALADHENGFREGYIEGAKWAINEFLKNLWHPTSEVPRNDYTDILVVCKEPQRPIVLFPKDILDGTPDDIASYNDMWMHLCDVYRITKYCYIGDLLPKKGGEK